MQFWTDAQPFCFDFFYNRSSVFYREYKCYGPGANTSKRVEWSQKLTAEEAKVFLTKNMIGGKSWIRSTLKHVKKVSTAISNNSRGHSWSSSLCKILDLFVIISTYKKNSSLLKLWSLKTSRIQLHLSANPYNTYIKFYGIKPNTCYKVS